LINTNHKSKTAKLQKTPKSNSNENNKTNHETKTAKQQEKTKSSSKKNKTNQQDKP